MLAYMGGFTITAAHWLSSEELQVRFTSTYGSTRYYQLYAGRSLVGVTMSREARSVIGTFKPSLWPQHITLLAVDSVDRLKDFGPGLPLRPYNKVKLRASAASYPADSEFLDVHAGTVPGGAVDANNRIQRVKYDIDREYELFTDPLPGSGTWNFEIAGRDDRPPDGNLGTALAISQEIIAHPPDMPLDDNGNRFSLSIASGTATFAFQ